MQKFLILCLLLVTACGGSPTDNNATRYNFAVVDGMNQSAAAGSNLSKPITTQLTRDSQGKFASRVFDFLAPQVAYAQQQLALEGAPIAGALICGRAAPVGEPQVVPLCAFTLSDGKAANVIQPGTTPGTYNVVFSAQVPSQEPVVDSTTVTVQPGPADVIRIAKNAWMFTGQSVKISALVIQASDKYGNTVTTTPKVSNAGGWTVVGDTAITSTVEREEPIQITIDQKTASVPLMSLLDLRSGLRAVGKCTGLVGIVTYGGASVDSVYFDVSVPEIVYNGQLLIGSRDGNVGRGLWAGNVTEFLHDGTQHLADNNVYKLNGSESDMRQAPDSIIINPGGGTAAAIAINDGSGKYVQQPSQWCWLVGTAMSTGVARETSLTFSRLNSK